MKGSDMHDHACLLCGGIERELLNREGDWTVYRCPGCGLGVLDPRPGLESLETLYQESYFVTRYDEGALPGSPEIRKRLSWEAQRVRFFRSFSREARILDIGSGRGYFLLACKDLGYTVEGFDLSEDAADYVRNTLNIPVTTGAIDKAPFADGSFDIITLWHSLEHMENPRLYLEQVHRLLRPGGFLVVEVPNHLSTDALRFGRQWDGWSLPYHLYHFTPACLDTLLGQHGFKVIRRKNYHSNWVKQKLRPIPVVGVFARLIAKCFSGSGYAVIARRLDRPEQERG